MNDDRTNGRTDWIGISRLYPQCQFCNTYVPAGFLVRLLACDFAVFTMNFETRHWGRLHSAFETSIFFCKQKVQQVGNLRGRTTSTPLEQG